MFGVEGFGLGDVVVLPPHPRPLSPVGGEGGHDLVFSCQFSVFSCQ